jgi:hypothetical protein
LVETWLDYSGNAGVCQLILYNLEDLYNVIINTKSRKAFVSGKEVQLID